MIKASLCYFKLFLSLAEVEHETEGTNVPQMEKKHFLSLINRDVTIN